MEVRQLTKEEKIARACHEVNRAYCQSIGDNSQMAWEDAPEMIRKSVVSGVVLHLEAGPQGVPPGTSHQAWLDYKLAEGWKWGPTKNFDTREHPNLMPFNDLPVNEQAKDFIFGAVVHVLRDWA